MQNITLVRSSYWKGQNLSVLNCEVVLQT